jgi:hypothetical protein
MSTHVAERFIKKYTLRTPRVKTRLPIDSSTWASLASKVTGEEISIKEFEMAAFALGIKLLENHGHVFLSLAPSFKLMSICEELEEFIFVPPLMQKMYAAYERIV